MQYYQPNDENSPFGKCKQTPEEAALNNHLQHTSFLQLARYFGGFHNCSVKRAIDFLLTAASDSLLRFLRCLHATNFTIRLQYIRQQFPRRDFDNFCADFNTHHFINAIKNIIKSTHEKVLDEQARNRTPLSLAARLPQMPKKMLRKFHRDSFHRCFFRLLYQTIYFGLRTSDTHLNALVTLLDPSSPHYKFATLMQTRIATDSKDPQNIKPRCIYQQLAQTVTQTVLADPTKLYVSTNQLASFQPETQIKP